MKMKWFAAAAASALLCTPAFAAAERTYHAGGDVQSVDASAKTVTLDNGRTYRLPAGVDVSTLNAGEAVEVAYTVQKGVRTARAVDSLTAASGQIKSVDAAKHTITLDDGQTYSLPAKYNMAMLKAGEQVELGWKAKGDAHEAVFLKKAAKSGPTPAKQ
ncbi:MAG: DUF1344 domain-containing protein [Alphaproteobacteria bacterium]|nr:DUF1344 domain-containing protein [Alphaproteobacteria bacterium]